MKETQLAVDLYLSNPQNKREFLAVKRPPNANSLPNVWGLPAVTMKLGEPIDSAIRRVGIEKLNTTVEPVQLIGAKADERDSYNIVLIDFSAEITGPTPNVRQAQTASTQYCDQQWTEDLTLLIPAATQGSLCSQILLDKFQVNY